MNPDAPSSSGETSRDEGGGQATVDLAALADVAASGVVGVRSDRRRATGTVIGAGAVLTAAHNARGREVEIVAGGSRRRAEITATAAHLDLVVLSADTTGLTPMSLSSTLPVVGASIAAAAAPDGVLRLTGGAIATLSAGFHTADGQRVTGVAEHTAPMPRGASGGPVLNARGEIVGIDINRVGAGFYQSLLADQVVQDAVRSMAGGISVAPKRLDIVLTDPQRAAMMRDALGLQPRDGLLVHEVAHDGAAAAAGLRRGDVISAIDGSPTSTPDQLHHGLRGAAAQVTLTVGRGVDPVTRDVVVDFTIT